MGFAGDGSGDAARERAQQARVADTIHRALPKELQGRLDDTIVFRPLAAEVLADLVRDRVARMSHAVGVRIALDDEQVSDIVQRARDTGLGARALDRIVATTVGVPLARKKRRGELKEGDTWTPPGTSRDGGG